MRNFLIVLLVGLFVLGAVPAVFAAHPTDVMSADPSEFGNGDNSGPVRDWGDDWIYYDDGGDRYVYFTYVGLWGRTSFTPNSEFRLEGVRLLTRNENAVDDDLIIRVYSENQNNRELDEILYEWTTDDIADGWWNHEIPEDDYITFEEGEHFSIAFGSAPSNPNGWWICGDNGTNVARSYVVGADDEGEPEDGWFNLDGNDLLLRANGTYMADFFDVGVYNVFNEEGWEEAGNWMYTPGTEVVFKADIANYGNDAEEEECNIIFTVNNPAGEDVFTSVVAGPALEMGDSTEIVCEEAWVVPSGEEAVLGLYNVWVEVSIQDDTNEDNNIMGLEQIVFDPEDDPDVWLGYIPGDDEEEMSECNLIVADGDGRGVLFYHPGGDMGLRPEFVRTAVSSDDVVRNPTVRVGIIDREANQFGWVWEGQGETSEEAGWEWIEYETPDTGCTFHEGFGLVVMYFYDGDDEGGTSMIMNSTPPVAGGASKMPWVISNGSENSLDATQLGDYAVQAKLVWDDAPPEGRYLRVDPADPYICEFGYDLERETEHTFDVEFYGRGTETVTVRAILIRGEDADYLTASINGEVVEEFDVESEQTVNLTLTYLAPAGDHFFGEEDDLGTTVRIVSNSENLGQFSLNIFGGTIDPQGVNENVRPGVPAEYSLSQNYPNPFNPTTTVDFALADAGNVNLSLYDMNGRLVMDMFNGQLSAGYHSIDINAEGFSAGVYLYRLTAGDFSAAHKMVLMK
ncbi:MAG: T9SS type A sorting domain-containing protein [Candidatus Electryoneaceae bacterium]|nr:T9SS type A sorting domain-containing protein [Candidatus Electryoneaceae bacterium]